ncbi:MAG: dihydropteroate synthase [Acidobacteria bacterium]|nr:dihydropteroate synthase [Acidobacteriota bacterium]
MQGGRTPRDDHAQPAPSEGAGLCRCALWGVLNVTPDSFSDGGRWLVPEAAVEHGLSMLDQGADLLDIGAESTRPGGGVYGAGADTVSVEQELRRLLPVLEGLRRQTRAPLSVDTRKGSVARTALDHGADLINDVSLLTDPDLGRAAAEADCPLILMHSRGELRSMQKQIRFRDVLAEVREELDQGRERAASLGLDPAQVVLDPGIGFGKTYEQNLELVAGLDVFRELGSPLLLGTSRKSFIGRFSAGEGLEPLPPSERLPGSLATVAWAAAQGVEMVRVHDVAETVQFLNMWSALRTARGGTP